MARRLLYLAAAVIVAVAAFLAVSVESYVACSDPLARFRVVDGETVCESFEVIPDECSSAPDPDLCREQRGTEIQVELGEEEPEVTDARWPLRVSIVGGGLVLGLILAALASRQK